MNFNDAYRHVIGRRAAPSLPTLRTLPRNRLGRTVLEELSRNYSVLGTTADGCTARIQNSNSE